jgi:hypothetical protein
MLGDPMNRILPLALSILLLFSSLLGCQKEQASENHVLSLQHSYLTYSTTVYSNTLSSSEEVTGAKNSETSEETALLNNQAPTTESSEGNSCLTSSIDNRVTEAESNSQTKGQTTILENNVTPSVKNAQQTTSTPQIVITTENTSVQTFTILSYSQQVAKGKTAEVVIQGVPGQLYSITVTYSSGPSSAKGLEDQQADADGICQWSFRVGAKTASGSYPICISDANSSQTVYITVE